MRPVARLVAGAGALAVVFAAAWGAGALAGRPEPVPAAQETGPEPVATAPAGTGLAATEAGYTLVPLVKVLEPGVPGLVVVDVTGPDGRLVTALDGPVRLAVARRDATAFQRLRPERGPGGSWQAALTLPAGGVYRLWAEVDPAGAPAVVLGTDLFAPGGFVPAPADPTRVAQLGPYQVRLDGELVAGRAGPVFATVSRDGVPVTDLEPLDDGTFGELVALRLGDLARFPQTADGPVPGPAARSGPGIAFTAEVPTSGWYRLVLLFRHGGVVGTAEFTVPTTSGPAG